MNPSFWQGRRVFLTGHTGFKGCWLKLWLEMLGAQIYGYALPPQPSSLYRDIYSTISDEPYGDVRDAVILRHQLVQFDPEIVFHLAAQPLVRESYKKPVLTYETNVMGTVNLLEAARMGRSLRSVVVVTTDKCYKDMNWEWGYRENDILGGADPYSSSKACVELLCEAWQASYFTSSNIVLATARAGNVIGGGDWAEDRLVPDAIRAFQKQEALKIRYPNALRPWQHVLEPLAGYLTLAERLFEEGRRYACGWNFGPIAEETQSVKKLVERLVLLWGDGASYQVLEDNVLHESHSLKLDSTRAFQKLEWRPKYKFEKAVDLTVDWYKRVFTGANPLSLTQEQILMYMEA